jgi:hypothetical protein
MKSKNSICRRCHRVSDVNRARYCAPCEKLLRDMEKPKRAGDGSGQPVLDRENAKR